MFLQPASFMIYDFMTYHGIKACTRMRPVLRTAKRNKRIEVQVEEEQVRLGLPKRCAKMRSASCASSSPCGMMAQCAVYRAVQSNRRLIRSLAVYALFAHSVK